MCKSFSSRSDLSGGSALSEYNSNKKMMQAAFPGSG
jgi:hypothetical protein